MSVKVVRNFEKFEVGNWYIYTGTERLGTWNDIMHTVLDHKPVRCIKNGCDMFYASFDRCDRTEPATWVWSEGFDNWIEIEDPTKSHDLTTGEYYYSNWSNSVICFSLERVSGTGKKGCFFKLTRPPLSKQKKASQPKFKVGEEVIVLSGLDNCKGIIKSTHLYHVNCDSTKPYFEYNVLLESYSIKERTVTLTEDALRKIARFNDNRFCWFSEGENFHDFYEEMSPEECKEKYGINTSNDVPHRHIGDGDQFTSNIYTGSFCISKDLIQHHPIPSPDDSIFYIKWDYCDGLFISKRKFIKL